MFVELIDNVRRFGLHKVFKRYYSFYRGEVVSVTDPEGRGRIQFRVPQILGEQTHPVFAEPKASTAGANRGAFWDVQPGDWVHIWFEEGDLRAPNWCCGWWAQGEFPAEFDAVNQRWGIKSRSGHLILFQDKAGEEKIEVRGNDGSALIIDVEGQTVTLLAVTDLNETVGGNWTVNVTGNASITAGGNATITATQIALNGTASGITTANSHLGVIDLITGTPVTASSTVFGDV